ncbi:MAG: LysR family transcriptional regulator [Verrucomicrobiales bacterium]|nr:LysR family transcriptional regulator [Verrucomicrobiales bacterium]
MDIRQITCFLAVAEELSFSRAAKRLHLAQSALSRTIQQLETEVGSPLFDRSRRAIRLTPCGVVLARDGEILLERIDDMMRRVRHAASGGLGELRLGYIGPPTRSFLGALLRRYREENPGVIVTLEERTPERVWEMVARGKLSVGLTRPVISHEALGLPSLNLLDEPLCAAVPSDHPAAAAGEMEWKDLSDKPLIVLARREGAGSHDTMLAACRSAGFSPRFAHTPSLIGTILRYVEFGEGIGIVPATVEPESPEVVLLPLKPRCTIPLVMVWSRDERDSHVTAFCDIVRDWLEERNDPVLPSTS